MKLRKILNSGVLFAFLMVSHVGFSKIICTYDFNEQVGALYIDRVEVHDYGTYNNGDKSIAVKIFKTNGSCSNGTYKAEVMAWVYSTGSGWVKTGSRYTYTNGSTTPITTRFRGNFGDLCRNAYITVTDECIYQSSGVNWPHISF